MTGCILLSMLVSIFCMRRSLNFELDLRMVHSVCGLPSGSGKSDVSSSDKSASSLFAAIAVVGVNKLQTQCVVVGRKDQKNLWFSVQCEPQGKRGQVVKKSDVLK